MNVALQSSFCFSVLIHLGPRARVWMRGALFTLHSVQKKKKNGGTVQHCYRHKAKVQCWLCQLIMAANSWGSAEQQMNKISALQRGFIGCIVVPPSTWHDSEPQTRCLANFTCSGSFTELIITSVIRFLIYWRRLGQTQNGPVRVKLDHDSASGLHPVTVLDLVMWPTAADWSRLNRTPFGRCRFSLLNSDDI